MRVIKSRYKSVISVFFLLSMFAGQAESLKNILQHALVYDPILLEAKADEESAYNRVEQAKSLHWPTVKVTADSRLLEAHDNQNNFDNSAITPGVEVSVNVYSFGAIDAEIKKNEYNETYFRHKYSESQEELGYAIGDLYLKAYDAKASIRVLKQSLKRHKRILTDLQVILDNDPGRESEYVQAQARQILVVQQINDYQRTLDSSLSSLSKYTRKFVTEKDLSGPFKGMSQKLLKNKFTLKEQSESPSFLAQRAELESKISDVEAAKAKRMPAVNLVGTATPKDKQLGLRLSWDVFNRSTGYGIQEKDSLRSAAERRLERVARDVDETARLALIDMKRSEVQLKTIKSQIKATAKVVEFYKLQFSIARRSLIEVLNAEKELADVELAQVSTRTQWNRAVLSYLRSQGMLSDWAGLAEK